MRIIGLSLILFFCAVLGYSSGMFQFSPELVQEDDLDIETLLKNKELHAGFNKVVAHKDKQRSISSVAPAVIDSQDEDTFDYNSPLIFETVRTMDIESQESYIGALRQEMKQESQLLHQMNLHGQYDDESKSTLREKIEKKQEMIDQLREEQNLSQPREI